MKVTSSYGVKLSGHNWRIFSDTVDLFRKAEASLLNVCLDRYEEWKDLPHDYAQSYINRLVHTTKSHTAEYPFFDRKFYKFPEPYRKSAIDSAMAIAKSYRSLVKQWEDDGRVGKKPALNRNQSAMPCLFNRDLYKRLDDRHCSIKLFVRNDWVWVDFRLRKSDVAYIQKHCKNLKESAPRLEKRMRHYWLRFTYERTVHLPDIDDPSEDPVICAVDLGVNTDAVCSILRRDGTVMARAFINSPIEKDHMYRFLERIKSSQRDGNKHHNRLWRFVDNHNEWVSIKTASEIVAFASAHQARVIVLEHLDLSGRLHGSKKQKLHLWRKKDILSRVTALAHANGMRVSTVNAWNTSRLAYDGTGRVERGIDDNYSICRFTTGKIYNCDLNASYNIGARYFIRLFMERLSATEAAALQAKVPGLSSRTQCTLSTLITLYAVLPHTSGSAEFCGVSVEGESVSPKERKVA